MTVVHIAHNWTKVLKKPPLVFWKLGSAEEASFLVSINFMSPCSVAKVCGVLSHTFLLLSSGGQPRAFPVAILFGDPSEYP